MAEYNSSEQESNLGQQLIKKANAAFNTTERRNVESIWSELSEFILPSQNSQWFGNGAKGHRRDQKLFDNTAPMASRDLASSLHSTVTNPSSKWSKIRFRETALNNHPAANAWTANATTEIHNALTDSNFDNQIGRGYQGYVGLATMAILHDEIYKDGEYKGLNFSSWHLSEIAYAENIYGIVDCIYRKFKLTTKQCYEMFGDNIGDLKDKLDSDPLKEQQLYHCIHPRDKKDIKLNILGQAAPKHRPFASYYVLCKGNKIVKEDGYYEFPVYVSRWLTLPGEIYGYGPGHIARADVLTLNVLIRDILKGLAKAVNPVIFQEQNNLLTGDMRPGKIVSVRNINGIKEGVTQSRFDVGFLEAKELRDSIKSAFYIDKLMLPPRTETGEMTAYEIRQRLEQMQVILGPPLSRLNTELLEPLIMRTLKILLRAGIIPPVPEEVIALSKNVTSKGMKKIDLDIAFVNSLARSQQMEEIRNISSWVQETAGISQLKPEVLDLINVDQVVEKMARIRDIPEELVNTDEEVQKIRADRQQAMQAQSALQAGEQMGSIVKNVAGAKEGNVQ
jgi:hypothetical protein